MSIPDYPDSPQELTEIEPIQWEIIRLARKALGADATNDELADWVGELRTNPDDGDEIPAVSRGLVAIIRDGTCTELSPETQKTPKT